ncbi:hypothetical protein NMF54_18915 [Clostridioides difficile]|uniref:hypothetical protein n=1 Tax=Clostridioides difficile TaxID=1496 RepID=UPI0020C55EE6|nr:hypothetical protein [Clostridioides difficile]MCP8421218.1 hypothetical protein [Clostridioides difficile]
MIYTIIGAVIMIFIFISALSYGNRLTRCITLIGGIIGFFIYGLPGVFMGVVFTAFVLFCIIKLFTNPKEFLSDVKDFGVSMYESAKEEAAKDKVGMEAARAKKTKEEAEEAYKEATRNYKNKKNR